MEFRSKNLLITGGMGFIGSNFIIHILENHKDINIINLDLLTYASDTNNLLGINKNDRYNFIHGDICDEGLVFDVFKNYKIDGVINFAAESHVDNSILSPEIFVKTNINGVFTLLKTAYHFWMNEPFKFKINHKLSRFHQVSTDEVYGSKISGEFQENSSYSPSSPYSASKAAADMLVKSFSKTYGLNTTISLSSNNFGLNQHNEKLIPKTINKIINNEAIEIYGDGNNIRDWIFVDDNCRAIELIFNKGKSGESYNIASKNEFSNIQIVNMISDILSKKLKIKFVNDRAGHDYRYAVSCQKIVNDLGWKIPDNFDSKFSNYVRTNYDRYFLK